MKQNIVWQTVKWTFIAGTFISAIIGLSSCSKKISCYSIKTVPVTFILKSGRMVTLPIRYCDTCVLNGDTIPQQK